MQSNPTTTPAKSRSRINHLRKVFRQTHDPLWHMQLGVILTMGMQLFTNNSFLPFHKIWLIGIEVVLLLCLIIATNEGYRQISRLRRNIVITLIGVIAAINIFSLILLMEALLSGYSDVTGRTLLLNGFTIYITNALLFALWYWELDGNGPDRRTMDQVKRDFIFPQMIHSRYAGNFWLPGFADYLYLSVTNVTNFGAADTQPISHRAKMLMMLQSLVAAITVVLVLARAVSVLQ